MTRTRVKICGITRPDYARAAAGAGADAIAAICDLLAPERAPASAARVTQLIEALGRTASHESVAEPPERDPTR